MKEKNIKCIFSTILKNESQDIFDKFITLESEVKNNNNVEYDENSIKKYFTFSGDIKFQSCSIYYEKLYNDFIAKFEYFKNDDHFELIYIIKKYKFKFQDNFYYCFEKNYLIDFLNKEYKKKKFHINLIIKEGKTQKITKELLFNYKFDEFEIEYNYNYKEVTLKELTKEKAFTNKELITASDLNYEFANYIQLEEEEFKTFYYIDSFERRRLINEIGRLVIQNNNFIALCGPFGCGKTVTLLKMINNPSYHSFYINLWTVFNLEIDELKKVLKYEYVKIIGKDYKENNDNDTIILNINKLDSPKQIYDFISNLIIILNKMNGPLYYLVLDQYSSKYDEYNLQIKRIKKEVIGTKIYMIICSSMNNYDVKENLAKSFSSSILDINQNIDIINYIYVGCLIKLDPLKEPLINESNEFKRVLSEFGNLPFYYYRLKENLRDNKTYETFLKEQEKTIMEEIQILYQNDQQNNIRRDIAKILYYIKDKEILLFNEIRENLLKLPLKFLDIKIQVIPIFMLMRYADKNKNFDLRDKVYKYISETKAEEISIISLMNSGICINKNDFSRQTKYNENREDISIFFLEGIFPYITDIFSKILYVDNVFLTRTFFSDLPAQTQGGIIEYYLLEYIRHNNNFFGININQFESIEVLVPNAFFYQNYSGRERDTYYDYIEKEDIDENHKIKIELPKKNILIKQKQYTGKYYDFAILIYSQEKNGYYLILFQVSKKKISSQILFKEEHEIALNRVKSNIEEDFNIEIISGHFCYIFTNFSKDNTALQFCEKYKILYLEFSFEEMKFNEEKPFNLQDSYITGVFPFHNYFSILSDNKFHFINILNNNNYDEIIKYKNLFTYIPINNENKNKLNWLFKIKKKHSTVGSINEYAIFGFFDNIQDFNTKFCLWYKYKEKVIFYYEDDKLDKLETDLDFSDVAKNEYILICSKYKYELLKSNDIDNFSEKAAKYIKQLLK